MTAMKPIDRTDATALPPKRAAGRTRRLLLMALVPVLLLGLGAWLYVAGLGRASTDNATIQQDRVAISPDVSGRIVAVAVRENQPVRDGDVLFTIDPARYRIALEQAEAAIASARLQVAQLRTSVNTEAVGVAAARETLGFAQTAFERQQQLLDRGFTTRVSYDSARHAVEQARADLVSAEARTANARAAVGDLRGPVDRHPLVLAAVAARDKAALDLERTVVRSPVAGTVTQTDRLQIGNVAVADLSLVSIVRADAPPYVEANFKETDLDAMRPGQPATVTIDAYPGRRLAARVASIGVGTGAEFAVLPAQNASGNWVKVTQRVPVRLALVERPRDLALIAGLSAQVTVDTRR